MSKKTKLDVQSPTAELKHNPFGALATAKGPEQTAALAPVEAPAAPPTKKPRGRLLLRRETKHRAGKAVVIISGFESLPELDAAGRSALARDLKQQLACGGALQTVRGADEIVIQGDHPARVAELLRARGYRVEGVTS